MDFEFGFQVPLQYGWELNLFIWNLFWLCCIALMRLVYQTPIQKKNGFFFNSGWVHTRLFCVCNWQLTIQMKWNSDSCDFPIWSCFLKSPPLEWLKKINSLSTSLSSADWKELLLQERLWPMKGQGCRMYFVLQLLLRHFLPYPQPLKKYRLWGLVSQLTAFIWFCMGLPV